ncbi:ParB N-terminal domain-containing protein [Nitrosopumilus sp.]|uniref:ParB N-terminal domain-containing protein n=1 Tax=Nitrosopumilus sp. TaxID=2024843 RepID=UPI002634FCDC|nr:ParB N-terminal domain-containing protein [Nitrosopumilus sp.]
MRSKIIKIWKLEPNPWHFRILSKKDQQSLISEIQKKSMNSIPLPIVASIEGGFYIVDGHSRIQAAKEAGIKEISCMINSEIKSYQELRIESFRLNRHGYSNPLQLSDMFNEDVKIHKSSEEVAKIYEVNEDFVHTLMNINKLHEDTKVIVQKIITVAGKKYRSLLDQISPLHISDLSKLHPEKQIELVKWIFHDIMYGPPIESHISIPSILEIKKEIEKINDVKEHNKYKKKSTLAKKQIPVQCRCGLKYEVDFKTNTIYEYEDIGNLTIKKEIINNIEDSMVFSSKNYTLSELKQIIGKNSKGNEIKIIITKGIENEDRQ